MSSAILTVVFGLAASLFWGSGDFCGGLASRRDNPSSVVMAAYGAGFVLLVAIALIWREPFPQPIDIVWGAVAGLAGTIGLVTFYSALSAGRMGIVAPISAILTAALPVAFGAFTQGLPGLIQIGGFVLALIAVGLISRPEQQLKGRPEGLGLALVAGLGFGCFFILISRVSHGATFWPLAVARITSMFLLLILLGVRRQRALPKKGVAVLVLLAGGLDALGNAFFVLATHVGRLDVAAILSSLYPAATVVLATIVLRERVTRVQAIGILLALVAIPLISTKF
jgi:drug/metabolite transporter (DMT)-like permease